MRFRSIIVTMLAALCAVAATSATAESRVALIIGNSAYAKPSLRLTNPANDAIAMQRALKDAGFDTTVKLNANRVDFYKAIEQFELKLSRDPNSVGLFYYAGHGVQADGVNYLIPVDADIQSDIDLEASAFDASRVLRAMQSAANEMNIVILDACRDNPLPRSRGMGRGLARMDAPTGTFIAYAAGPGQSAMEGALGTNGVFTGELVKAMAQRGLTLEAMFKQVIRGVRADTQGTQQPWSEASLQGDFYFHQTVAELSPPGSSTTTSVRPESPKQPQPATATAAKVKGNGENREPNSSDDKTEAGGGRGPSTAAVPDHPTIKRAAPPPTPALVAPPTPVDPRCASLQGQDLLDEVDAQARAQLAASCGSANDSKKVIDGSK